MIRQLIIAAAAGLAAPGCAPSGGPDDGDTSSTVGSVSSDGSEGSTDAPTGTSGLTETDPGDTSTGTTEPAGTSTGSTTGDQCALADDNFECNALVDDRGLSRVVGPTPALSVDGTLTLDSRPKAAETCDIFAQDCPEGQKCNPYADDLGPIWNSVGCFSLYIEPGKVGDPCSANGTEGPDTCEAGAFCMFDPHVGSSFCEPLCGCSAETPTCGENEKCFVLNNGVLPLCETLCDPLAAQPCADGQVCIKGLYADFICSDDVSGENGTLGDPCKTKNDCDPGHSCEVAGYVPGGCEFDAQWCCTPLCDLDEPVCPDGSHCVEYFGGFGLEAPVCLEDVGFCVADDA